MKTEDEKRFDVRTFDRNLKDRLITKSDLDKHHAALADISGDADWVSYAQITSSRVGKLAALGDGGDAESGASSSVDLDD
jgi:hypothetical protein